MMFVFHVVTFSDGDLPKIGVDVDCSVSDLPQMTFFHCWAEPGIKQGERTELRNYF